MPDTAAAQLRRLLLLIPEVADGKERKIEWLEKRLGIERSTLLRDLTSLANRFDDPGGFVEGVQIYLDSDSLELRSNHFLRPMRLTLGELGAIELGLALLRSERPPEEHGALDRARDRLAKVLARLPDDPLPAATRAASLGTEADGPTLAAIRRAMREGRKLRIGYRSSAAREGTERVVCPYAPVFASGAWYLVAHCDRSEGLRVFRLDRVEAVEPLEERYRVPEDFSLDQVVRGGRVFHGEPNERVRVRYGPAVARWIAEREHKPLDPDGSLTLDHPLADTAWAVRHALQYGPDAEVLEPAEVREAVRRSLARMAETAP